MDNISETSELGAEMGDFHITFDDASEASELRAGMEDLNISTPRVSHAHLPQDSSLSFLGDTPSITSEHSDSSGDTVMEQGAPNGPPVKDWVFDDKTSKQLKNYFAFLRKNGCKPSGPRLAEEQEIYCECNGIDDGSPMIKCDNGTFCLKEWFHMACIGMKPPGPQKGGM